MVWKKIGIDGKPRYIQGRGNFFYLSKEKNGALESVPDGWEVTRRKNNRLALVKSN